MGALDLETRGSDPLSFPDSSCSEQSERAPGGVRREPATLRGDGTSEKNNSGVWKNNFSAAYAPRAADGRRGRAALPVQDVVFLPRIRRRGFWVSLPASVVGHGDSQRPPPPRVCSGASRLAGGLWEARWPASGESRLPVRAMACLGPARWAPREGSLRCCILGLLPGTRPDFVAPRPLAAETA